MWPNGDGSNVNGTGGSNNGAPPAAPVAQPSFAPPPAPTPAPGSQNPPGVGQSSAGYGQASQQVSAPQPAGYGQQTQPTQQAQAQQQAESVRDALASYGIDLRGQFQDDRAALAYLANQYRQAQQYAQAGQVYLQHRSEFERWQDEQKRQAAAQDQQKKSWWNAPQYDPGWFNKLTRNAYTNQLEVLPGHDPAIVQRVLAWQEHQRNFLDKFSQDPITAIRPGIEEVVQQVAARMVQEQLGGYSQQMSAREVYQQNQEWMVETDPQTGRPTLSPLGHRYAEYVKQADQAGLQGVQAQHQYALGMTQRDYLLSRVQQGGQQQQQPGTQQQVDPNQQVKNNFLQNAAQHQYQMQQPPPPPGNSQAPPPVRTGPRALREMMLADMQANGFAPGATVPV